MPRRTSFKRKYIEDFTTQYKDDLNIVKENGISVDDDGTSLMFWREGPELMNEMSKDQIALLVNMFGQPSLYETDGNRIIGLTYNRGSE